MTEAIKVPIECSAVAVAHSNEEQLYFKFVNGSLEPVNEHISTERLSSKLAPLLQKQIEMYLL
jgi:hypothetical protein